MTYRFCNKCDQGMDRITLEEISAWSYGKVPCPHCLTEREDDTWRERTSILAEAILERKVNE